MFTNVLYIKSIYQLFIQLTAFVGCDHLRKNVARVRRELMTLNPRVQPEQVTSGCSTTGRGNRDRRNRALRSSSSGHIGSAGRLRVALLSRVSGPRPIVPFRGPRTNRSRHVYPTIERTTIAPATYVRMYKCVYNVRGRIRICDTPRIIAYSPYFNMRLEIAL